MFEKIGIVTSIYPNKCTARVKFEDADDLISAELQVVVRGSLNNKDYWMPKVGEHVLCIFTKQKSGYIVGSIYSKQSPPPVNVEYKRHMQFEDGTTIEYDSKSKTLDINCVGPIKIKATGHVHVTGNIYVSGDVIADGISLKNHIHSCPHGSTSPPNR